MTNEAGNQGYISAETVPLLPCPFCGEKRISLNLPNKHDRHGSINCPGCMVVLPGAMADQSELVNCWNTRVGWQPIETAPRDGTTILGVRFDQGVNPVGALATYSGSDYWFSPTIGHCLIPTHWMPLPAPPTEGEG